jgi:hypothetical protein
MGNEIENISSMAFHSTAIQRLDLSEAQYLESADFSYMMLLRELILPKAFNGLFTLKGCPRLEKLNIGNVEWNHYTSNINPAISTKVKELRYESYNSEPRFTDSQRRERSIDLNAKIVMGEIFAFHGSNLKLTLPALPPS